MYYLDESLAVRPVQVSIIFVDGHNAVIAHESELPADPIEMADCLGFLRPPSVDGVVGLDGCISLVFRGEECLGWDYWMEFYARPSLGGLVCGQSKIECRFHSDVSTVMWFHARGDHVLAERDVDKKGRRFWTIPTAPLVREWFLMNRRIDRLKAVLGDASASHRLANVDSVFVCDAERSLVDPRLVDYTCRADLAEVLSNPVPSELLED